MSKRSRASGEVMLELATSRHCGAVLLCCCSVVRRRGIGIHRRHEAYISKLFDGMPLSVADTCLISKIYWSKHRNFMEQRLPALFAVDNHAWQSCHFERLYDEKKAVPPLILMVDSLFRRYITVVMSSCPK